MPKMILNPIPHPEASIPLQKIESIGMKSQSKTPNLVDVAKRHSEFMVVQANHMKAEVILEIAQDLKAGRLIKLDSPEYKIILKRQQKGESIDDIIGKSEVNVESLYGITLDKELLYLESEESLLRSEIGSPITHKDILRVIKCLEQNHMLKPDDQALVEVNKRRQLGENLMSIKIQAQQVEDLRNRTSETLRIAEAIKHYENTNGLDIDIEATIRSRMLSGEKLDDIIRKTKANLDGYEKIDNKKSELTQILKRIQEIKNEKQVIWETKQKNHELESKLQLTAVRERLKDLQVENVVETTSKPNPEAILRFQDYINKGGQLIKAGKYTEAIEYFENKQEITKINWRISQASSIVLNELPKPNKNKQLADKVAENSWCKVDNTVDNTIELSNINYYITGPDGKPLKQNHLLPAELLHEVSLIHMEEWLHCLQSLRGVRLTGQPNKEIDIAVYMEMNGIPMTKAFKQRYGRGEALKNSKRNGL